ncbi:MAG: leucine--tRNA ligase [Saprospirales bacterium]|nr:MAG: leucine--tRNA ligase [Saprospirales bacterium]
MEYNTRDIEIKWQKYWKENKTYKTDIDPARPKYYILDMFPYPSGAGLHVGHPLGYIASDIMSRYKRHNGYQVLHPMGYDAFGLPAEQYALQTGVHPAISTQKNIDRYREQLSNLGFDYDWSRELATCDPDYYKWTQWIFIQWFNHYYCIETDKARPIADLVIEFEKSGNTHSTAFGSQDISKFSAEEWKAMTEKEKSDLLMNYRIAYRKTSYVNWCPALGTVLANDEVKDGLSERGGHPVERKPMLQWSLRISAYAERLLRDLEHLDWTDSLKSMQRNWIGKSTGAMIRFRLDGHEGEIEVFTTRPDTVFGATFMVLAPEHPLVETITTTDRRTRVAAYQKKAASLSERDRQAGVDNVSGEFTGAYAIHPITHKKIPVWISDYVLMDYGTGAIMAVPSDDDRDHRFATYFEIEIIPVVDKTDKDPERHRIINSEFLNGLTVKEGKSKIIEELEKREIGERKVKFKLRDAIFSRQRYWGEPIPILYDKDGIPHAMHTSDLPLELPDLDDFKPGADGRSPLSKNKEWVNAIKEFTRETDTMPGFAGSSWYFLRYMDPRNKTAFASSEAIKYWRDVDLYIGGTEHAVGHLIYARFCHKFLYDIGKVVSDEPFKKLINQGMIQGVIESVYLDKRSQNPGRFVCSGIADKEGEEHFTRILIHVDFVKNYGAKDSYISSESIEQFLEWNPSFKNAVFECSGGIYQNGNFTPHPGSSANDSHLLTHSEVGKMSKSKYNVINPDEVIEQYGTDCFRMYEMFLGPIEQSKPWDTQGIDGVSKFLRKFRDLFFKEGNFQLSDAQPTKEANVVLHQTIKRVREDIERFSFNTCVSHFMVATNELRKLGADQRSILEPLIVLISPFAPHLAEELWHLAGNEDTVTVVSYPEYDEAVLKKDEIVYPVAINGKKRTEITFPFDAEKQVIEESVIRNEIVLKWKDDKQIKRVIVVPGKMINVVVG